MHLIGCVNEIAMCDERCKRDHQPRNSHTIIKANIQYLTRNISHDNFNFPRLKDMLSG